jgi:hypothetical protein
MRVWDSISPSRLCRQHLLAEHRETLCIWSVITNNKKGYSQHPETVRFRGNLNALAYRHNELVKRLPIVDITLSIFLMQMTYHCLMSCLKHGITKKITII